MSAVPVGSLARVVVDSAYMWSSWTSGQLGATVVSSLAGGMLVLVLERQDDGCRILLPDGRTGWLRVSWLDPVAVQRGHTKRYERSRRAIRGDQ